VFRNNSGLLFLFLLIKLGCSYIYIKYDSLVPRTELSELDLTSNIPREEMRPIWGGIVVTLSRDNSVTLFLRLFGSPSSSPHSCISQLDSFETSTLTLHQRIYIMLGECPHLKIPLFKGKRG
jgi:hypothetical protein